MLGDEVDMIAKVLQKICQSAVKTAYKVRDDNG